MQRKTAILIAASIVLALTAGSAQAAPVTIFSHTFDEGTGGLNGTAVDSGTGAPQNWVAVDTVNANGGFTTNANFGSATLAFAPSQGFEYTLDARITGVTGDVHWVAMGFANGQSTTAGNSDRFIAGNVVGTAWSFLRGDNSSDLNEAHNGTGELNAGNSGLGGEDWSALNFQDGTTPGNIDMRIVLDTTGGTGTWTATWLAKETTDTEYITVRATDAVLPSSEENFTSVGFAFSNGTVDGSLESFSLTSVPEPGSLALMGLGGLLVARRRRNA